MGAGAIRLRTPVAGALRSIMVWGGICGRSACVRCSGKGAWNVVGGGERVGAAGAVKNERGRGTCLTMPVAGVLHSLMVWAGKQEAEGVPGVQLVEWTW